MYSKIKDIKFEGIDVIVEVYDVKKNYESVVMTTLWFNRDNDIEFVGVPTSDYYLDDAACFSVIPDVYFEIMDNDKGMENPFIKDTVTLHMYNILGNKNYKQKLSLIGLMTVLLEDVETHDEVHGKIIVIRKNKI